MNAEHATLPVLTTDELARCAEGECVRCGRCCIAFQIWGITSDPTHSGADKFTKEAGEPCPHLVDTGDGHYHCGVQEFKDHPALATCADFLGTEGRMEDLYEAIREWACQPASLEQVERLRDWHRRGLLADVPDMLRSSSDLQLLLVSYLCNLRILPCDLFDLFGLRAFLAQIHPDTLSTSILPRCGIVPTDPLHAEFLRRYLPEYRATEAESVA